MLQNARVTACTFFEILRENQQGGLENNKAGIIQTLQNEVSSLQNRVGKFKVKPAYQRLP